jgi:hypothetical protein
MSEIVNVKLTGIDPNPMRQLAKYPYNEDKLEALIRSITDVGLWEGVIGRRQGNRIQLAFGHHRVEAARRSRAIGKDGKIPVIVRDLDDEQMLQFMGRENLEDYNADFLVMLETWEAAEIFIAARDRAQNPETLVIAQLLGWIRGNRDTYRINDVAVATSSASKLIKGGYLKRSDLTTLSVRAVREICGRVVTQHEMLERMAKKTKLPARDVEQAKHHSGKAGVRVARDVREGRVAQRDIRGQVDVEAYRHAKEVKRQSPLFSMFGKSLADSIARIAKDDSIGEKLREIKSALGNITLDDDVQVVKRIALECEGASGRFDKWAMTFSDPKKKVVPLKEVTSKD